MTCWWEIYLDKNVQNLLRAGRFCILSKHDLYYNIFIHTIIKKASTFLLTTYYSSMFHYLRGTYQNFGTDSYIVTDTFGVQVQYTGRQTVGEWWLHPRLDTNNNTIDYIAFDSHEHYDLFKSFIKISGIGSKTAMLITTLGKNELTRIVTELDTKALSAIPGIGSKTAKRILIELKDTLTHEEIKSLDTNNNTHTKTIIKHLTGLGYEKNAVANALDSYHDPITTDNVNEVIKWFVKNKKY